MSSCISLARCTLSVRNASCFLSQSASRTSALRPEIAPHMHQVSRPAVRILRAKGEPAVLTVRVTRCPLPAALAYLTATREDLETVYGALWSGRPGAHRQSPLMFASFVLFYARREPETESCHKNKLALRRQIIAPHWIGFIWSVAILSWWLLPTAPTDTTLKPSRIDQYIQWAHGPSRE